MKSLEIGWRLSVGEVICRCRLRVLGYMHWVNGISWVSTIQVNINIEERDEHRNQGTHDIQVMQEDVRGKRLDREVAKYRAAYTSAIRQISTYPF